MSRTRSWTVGSMTAARTRWGGIVLAAAALMPDGSAALAQQPPRPIEAVAVAPGVTALVMHPDGTVLVVAGDAGTLLVDAGAPARAAEVDSAVAAHARGPVRWVVSTHYHEDHIGGNPRFRAAGAELIAHPRVAIEAAKDTTIAALQWQRRAAPADALPMRTFTDSLVIDIGEERVVAFHVPSAHTGGDALAHVLGADVLHTGDIVEFGAYPFVDRWAGGSIDGVIAATDAILARTGANTRIVPGHGGVFTRADVVAYRALLVELRARVQRAVDAGTPVEALVAERITAPYDARHGGARHGERFVRLLYGELSEVSSRAPEGGGLSGRVEEADGTGAAGMFVTVRRDGSAVAHTRVTGEDGGYAFPPIAAGDYTIRAHRPDRTPDSVRVSIGADGRLAGAEGGTGGGPSAGAPVVRDLRVHADRTTPAELPASAFLALLPEGEEKRRFVLDCTGCHTFDDRIALPQGAPRTHAGWAEAVARMLGFSGPNSGFPVIAAGREPDGTAAFLSLHVNGPPQPSARTAPPPDPATAGALITEYDIPEPGDLPHDVAIDSAGRVVITGMFTARMYVLDPATGAFETVPIAVANANPRAVEVSGDGDWWVLLGGPHQVARYDPDAGEWATFPIGMYGHSLGPDTNGRVWFNGHFTKAPELMGWIDAATGAVETVEVPLHPTMAQTSGPIPYELRVAPDGGVWITELAGNRVIRFDPATRRFDVHAMPSAHSGPRRIDIASDGTVWIPEYSANRLARLDPATGAFREWVLPIADALPYVARVDARTGVVWIGSGAADALFAFDPGTERFTTYRLPTRGALVRHLAIDPRNGDVWAAYGASPGIPSKVARVRVR